MTIRVLLVDDHPAVIGGLERIIESTPDLRVVGTARTVAEASRRLRQDDIDVAIIDMRLPDGLGTTLVREASARGRPATLVLSSFDHRQYVATAVRSGAQGFLLKTATLDEVAEAIRIVDRGGLAFTAEQLRTSQAPAPDLSDRERGIIAGIQAGKSNDEIAMAMGLSRKTVEASLSRIFERMGILSRAELAIRAEREGWLEPL
ncbi:MAG TPA: response regulator transcription factor [Candidatus Limnocylindrales bacterium]|jgi:DNA-binding NarL/FixJ family response regulator|nr:response regulator transcription factor [Candidatus Limnocylindrales bacterium]